MEFSHLNILVPPNVSLGHKVDIARVQNCLDITIQSFGISFFVAIGILLRDLASVRINHGLGYDHCKMIFQIQNGRK